MINCPNCNGNLKYDISKGRMLCKFCESTFDPYEFDDKSKDGEISKDYETTIYTCPECGGEIQSTDNEITGFCPFCGGATIFYQRLEKELKPDYVIPFIKTKEDCKKAYFSKIKKSWFLPKEYKDEKFVDGFRGIYMPYWSYDISQKGEVTVEGEKTHRSGDYIIHDFYNITGDMDTYYNGITYDASSSFSDDISDKLGPFDVKKKVPFTAGFLSGFYADTADVDSRIYLQNAKDFANNQSFASMNKHPLCAPLSLKKDNPNKVFHTEVADTQRTLFPVWFMSYRKNDRVAYATVNGQTGKVVADTPIDFKKFLIFAGVLAVILFAILNAIFVITPHNSVLVVGIVEIISLATYLIESLKIAKKEKLTDDKGFNSANQNSQIRGDGGYSTKKMPIFTAIVAIGICAIAWLSNSIHDEFIYGSEMISAVLISVTLGYLIKEYNLLTTRRLPQFDKKGGDDNA